MFKGKSEGFGFPQWDRCMAFVLVGFKRIRIGHQPVDGSPLQVPQAMVMVNPSDRVPNLKQRKRSFDPATYLPANCITWNPVLGIFWGSSLRPRPQVMQRPRPRQARRPKGCRLNGFPACFLFVFRAWFLSEFSCFCKSVLSVVFVVFFGFGIVSFKRTRELSPNS